MYHNEVYCSFGWQMGRMTHIRMSVQSLCSHRLNLTIQRRRKHSAGFGIFSFVYPNADTWYAEWKAYLSWIELRFCCKLAGWLILWVYCIFVDPWNCYMSTSTEQSSVPAWQAILSLSVTCSSCPATPHVITIQVFFHPLAHKKKIYRFVTTFTSTQPVLLSKPFIVHSFCM